MSSLFPNRWSHFLKNHKKPQLEAITGVEQIKPTMRFYENQEQWDHLTLLLGTSFTVCN